MSNYLEKQTAPNLGTVSIRDADSNSNSFDEKKDIAKVSAVQFHERETIIDRIRASDDMRDILTEDADFIVEKMATLDSLEAQEVLVEAMNYYDTDINFPAVTLEKMEKLLHGEEAYGQGAALYDLDLRLEACLIKYHSPYPEVRSVCSPIDDPTVPVETFRAYVIGLFWVAVGAFINQMISYRQPHFSLTSQVIQILIYPCGKIFHYVLPAWTVPLGRFSFNLNPGPWTFKEQMFVTIITNVGAHSAVFLSYAPTMRLKMFYGQEWMGYGFTVLMGFCCQFFGMGMAGVLRRWAIYPSKAVWPTILPTLQLNRTLLLPDNKKSINGWTITKYKLFFIVMSCTFFYFFIPDYLFTALSTFNWITWIAPHNKNLAFVTGSKIGVGFNPLTTFDWSVINYSSPLVLPFFTVVNRYIGTIVAGITLLIMYYTNYKFTSFIPPNTSDVYDRFGEEYNVTRVLRNGRFDLESYLEYSPPYISAGQLMYQGAAYTIYTFAFVYVFLNEWHIIKEAVIGFYNNIKNREMSNYDRYKDPLSVMMRQYKEVPDWWFLVILVMSVVVGIVSIRCFPTTTPVWAIVVVLLVSIALLIPFIVLYSSTGYFMSMNNLATILGGYMVPGNGLACIFTRIFGYGLDEQSETYVGDQKLAHYAKLPPRAVFRGQVIATLVQIFVTAGAVEFLVQGMPDFCSWTNEARFVCTFAHTLYADSLLMGVVGPHRTFDVLYPTLKYAFLIGAVLAFPCYLARRYFPKHLRFFHPVLFLGGFLRYGSTYNLAYYTPGFYASFVFMFYIRRRYLAWWAKYNYIISSALTAGVAFSGILIFLALQYKPKRVKWWGTTVQSAGIDGAGTATLKDIPEIGYFGLPEGSWE
ncbi:OPT oligopeptide transporter protein-domain-containing protein [Lipomyces tetrasporus]|uniref:OPT oligopeptide transporter protein-domain-containing protein n=1 Tax=Lipomyces tetrasporus TaxID=54092 RepID=A0AAD7QMZ7_9ASCO|nr:OPT oligopeptide transporter protein-domain-containing protein [Lipomyces tetrasporus]KAJ8098188.1 OPT oligopeptide transporter protein-domain-containing protein [Lipomyces tetrasporus]